MFRYIEKKDTKLDHAAKKIKNEERENSELAGDAICEIAEMVVEQETAILELAEIIGGMIDG